MFVQQNPIAAIALIAFFLLLAFPVHEFAHAFAAYRLGDGTPKLFGRLTLNPVAHFDPFGGTMLVLSILILGIPFGFAQTPINPRNLRGRYGQSIVSVAGPVSNLLTAAVFAIVVRILFPATAGSLLFATSEPEQILKFIVYGSLILGIFNLIPIPPLDGGAILLDVAPPRTAWRLRPFFAQYGLLVIILLIVPLGAGGSILSRVLQPLAQVLYHVLVG